MDAKGMKPETLLALLEKEERSNTRNYTSTH